MERPHITLRLCGVICALRVLPLRGCLRNNFHYITTVNQLHTKFQHIKIVPGSAPEPRGRSGGKNRGSGAC